MNLGDKIAKIRKDNKMSQEDFAEIFNVTRQTISSWENSKSYPDIESLIKLSDKFNISLDILLKENIDMVKDIDKKVKDNKKLKRIIILIITIILVVLLTLIGIKIIDKKQTISLESELMTEINKSLNRWYGDNPIYYTDKDIDLKDSLILAIDNSFVQYNNDDSIKIEDRKMCEIDTDTNVEDFDKSKCIYSVATKEDINDKYNLLFGSNVPKYVDIFDKTNCKLGNNGKYYCAKKLEDNNKEKVEEDVKIINVKAKRNINNNIDIYQYYLRIKDNKCYSSSLDIENKKCTKEYIDAKVDEMNFDERYNFKEKLIKKYGTYYKVTIVFNLKYESYFWRNTKVIK